MASRPVVAALIFLLEIYVASSKLVPEIPSYLKICHRSDPNLNQCVRDSVESLRPYLKDGIAALHIPPCEPLYIPEIEISQSAGPVSIRSTYNDIKIFGGTNFVLKGVKVDLKKNRIRLKLYIPHLEMLSRYEMDGKILMLPITGNGLAHGNYSDIDVLATIQGERYEDRKTQMVHFRVLDFYIDFDIGHASIHLDNLFNGDDTLSDAMNLFLNDNWRTVAAEVKPALEETVGDLFKAFSNQIYSKFPLNVLLPP